MKVGLGIGGSINGFKSYDGVVEKESPENLEDASMRTTMLYTSGTTERPNPGQLIEVRDDEGEVLAAGEIGTVYIGAPEEGRFEYYKDPGKTANAEWGEEIKAVVQLRDEAKAGKPLAQELIEYCRARLAHYKCPRSVDFVRHLPRYETGKIYRRLVRDRYWAGRDRSI